MLTMSDVKQINAEFRAKDESHLYPICGKFNATKRAIRTIRRSGVICDSPLEYSAVLDAEISRIVCASSGG